MEGREPQRANLDRSAGAPASRLRGAPPSPLRYDAIAPKPKAKAEERRFGAAAAGPTLFALASYP